MDGSSRLASPSSFRQQPGRKARPVIGKPDPQRTEIVKAVIVLKSGVEGTEDLKSEIQQMVRQRLSTHAYPREIDFIAALPKTPSGKVQRFVLRGGSQR